MAMQETDENTLEPDETLKDLRAAAGRSKEHAAEALAAKRELAFIKAGLNVDDPIVAHVMKSYDGELTSEAVKARATELGLERLVKEASASEGTTDEGESTDTSQTDARNALTEGAAPPSSKDTDADPRMVGLAAFNKALESGDNRQDASGAFFREIFDAAARGDKRVLVAPDNPGKAEQRYA